MAFNLLIAGDNFITPKVFRDAINQSNLRDVRIHETLLPWPDIPFHPVAEVREASGSEEEMIDALQGMDGIVTQLAPITRKVIKGSPSLRFVGVSRGGPVNVNLKVAESYGITVVNVPGRNKVATAEMALGMILSVLRRVPQSHVEMIDGKWNGSLYRLENVGREVRGAKVGLVGLGAIGTYVAAALSSLGAVVQAYDPFIVRSRVSADIHICSSIEELLTTSDIVSLHARSTPDTKRLICKRSLEIMKNGSYLINSARGDLVDLDATVAALETGKLSGVALDVFDEEPAPFSHRLFELGRRGYNVVLTPHVAGASKGSALRGAAGIAEELRRFLQGEMLANPLLDTQA